MDCGISANRVLIRKADGFNIPACKLGINRLCGTVLDFVRSSLLGKAFFVPSHMELTHETADFIMACHGRHIRPHPEGGPHEAYRSHQRSSG